MNTGYQEMKNTIQFKNKLLSSLFSLGLIFNTVGCGERSNGILSDPPAGVTAVTLFIAQVDTSGTIVNRIFVFAEDQVGTVLSGFKIGNFSILEDGKVGVPFEVGPVLDPLYLALAIDRSGSMSGSRTTAANAAAEDLINALDTADSAAIIDFESSVTVTVDFTADKGKLVTAIRAGVASGGTALYDAIDKSADLLKGQPGRRLLVVLTDGADTASSGSMGSAISTVNSNGLSAYTVGLGTGFEAAILAEIANQTGGSFNSSAIGTDLTSIFLSILNRFNNLTYIKYRRRQSGQITVFLNYGNLTSKTQKLLD